MSYPDITIIGSGGNINKLNKLCRHSKGDRVISVEEVQMLHDEEFWNFVSICNTDRNKYTTKLKGTKKCNLRFADSRIRLSSFYIIKTRQDLTIRYDYLTFNFGAFCAFGNFGEQRQDFLPVNREKKMHQNWVSCTVIVSRIL